jgi:hypothetical protein
MRLWLLVLTCCSLGSASYTASGDDDAGIDARLVDAHHNDGGMPTTLTETSDD